MKNMKKNKTMDPNPPLKMNLSKNNQLCSQQLNNQSTKLIFKHNVEIKIKKSNINHFNYLFLKEYNNK